MQRLLAFSRGNTRWNESLPHIFCNAQRMCDLNRRMPRPVGGGIGLLALVSAEYADGDSVIQSSGAG